MLPAVVDIDPFTAGRLRDVAIVNLENTGVVPNISLERSSTIDAFERPTGGKLAPALCCRAQSDHHRTAASADFRQDGLCGHGAHDRGSGAPWMTCVPVGHEAASPPGFRDPGDDLGHAFLNGDQPLALRQRGQRAPQHLIRPAAAGPTTTCGARYEAPDSQPTLISKSCLAAVPLRSRQVKRTMPSPGLQPMPAAVALPCNPEPGSSTYPVRSNHTRPPLCGEV